MARDAKFDLGAALARPGFTPGARDAPALVELVVRGDEPAATRAAPALAGLRELGRQAIEARLAGARADHEGERVTAREMAGEGNDRSKRPAARGGDERTMQSTAGGGGRERRTPGAARVVPDVGESARAEGVGEDANARLASAPAVEGGVDEGGKARLVGVLGLLARAGDDDARAAVIAHASDIAPRVRRAAIVALGKLGGDDARRVLLARWDAGDATADERRALAEALGKVGGDDALARLRALDTGDDAELVRRRDRAVLMADRSAKRDAESRIAVDAAPPAPVAIQLGCRTGLAGLLREELTALGLTTPSSAAHRDEHAGRLRDERAGKHRDEHAGRLRDEHAGKLRDERARTHRDEHAGKHRDEHAGGRRELQGGDGGDDSHRSVEIELAAPLGTLFASRLWATIAIPIRLARANDLAAAITQTIVAPSTRALLRAWTRGPIRWRLGFAHGHKRAIVWRVARDVTAAAPELINDPTATTWDVLVDDEAGSLALVPRRLDDPRFAYRLADVPAASHPTVAAALAWVAEARPDDRVWDPFCGSGLELIERARRGPARSLVGTDIDPVALDAARRNVSAAGVQVELAVADARSHAPGAVDLIVTNPPLGSRVQIDAAALLVAALPSFVRALAPRGRLVWITPSARKTTPVAEQLGLVRARGLAVDLGGVRGHLERWDRR